MLHLVAFIVIGLVVGAIFIGKTRARAAMIRVGAGLVGSLAGGFIALGALGSKHLAGKYGSLVVAVVVAVVLTAIAMVVTRATRVSGAS